MAVVSCERFLLLRASTAQLKAANGLNELSEALGVFVETVGAACQDASVAIEQVRQKTWVGHETARAAAADTQAALDSGDLAAMEAQREAVLAALRAACRRCNAGTGPFEVGCDCVAKDR